MTELSLEIDRESTIFSGDISQSNHLTDAAGYIAAGDVVAIDNDSVWGLWGDAANPWFVKKAMEIKGRQPDQRFALTMPFDLVAGFADYSRLNPQLWSLFENPQQLTDLVGGLAFIRYPVDPEILKTTSFGPHLLSTDESGGPVLQNYDPSGKCLTELVVLEALAAGAHLPAATSMNVSGQHEIISMQDAQRFVREHGINRAYVDSTASRAGMGSYAIIEARDDGLRLIREGNISNCILKRLFTGLPYSDENDYKPTIAVPQDDFDDLTGAELRQAILVSRGWDRLPVSD